MLHITSLDDGLDIFKALGSNVRIEIIKLLIENKEMNMNELAAKLNITNGALTGHIKKLEACGIINISNDSSGHGNQKICTLHLDKILIDLDAPEEAQNVYNAELQSAAPFESTLQSQKETDAKSLTKPKNVFGFSNLNGSMRTSP